MAYQNVLVCLDLRSQEAPRLIDRALSMARDPRMVTALTVIEMGTHDEERDVFASLIEEVYLSRSAHLARICKGADISVEQQRVLVGRAATEIATFSSEHAIDLVVLGEHGGRLLRPFLGSTTYQALHLLDCDALVVRSDPRSDGQDSNHGSVTRHD